MFDKFILKYRSLHELLSPDSMDGNPKTLDAGFFFRRKNYEHKQCC